MPQFPFPEGDGFGGIAFHEVSCRRFVFVLGHDGDRYAEYGRLSGGGSLFEDGPRVTSASTRSTASPSSCPVPSLPFPVSLIGRKAQRIPFSTICSACRFHAFCRAERWLGRPFMRVPRPSSPVDGRQRLSARSFCLRAVPWLLHEAWATVFALSRVLWGSEQLFLRCKRTSIAHDVKIT